MPTYSYRCTECDNAFDIQQSFTDDSLTVCPVCSGKLRKVFSAVGVTFNGSGFYRTDSRSSGATKSSSDGGSGSSGAGSAGSGSSGSSDSSSGSSGAKSDSGTGSSKPSKPSSGSTPSTGSSSPAKSA